MADEETLSRLVNVVRSLPELEGCTIGFEGSGMSRLLYSGRGVNSSQCAVVIEEIDLTSPPPPSSPTNGSRLRAELVGAGFTCGSTIVSAVGLTVGVAGELPTGGLSTFLTVASYLGLTANAFQCVYALARVRESVFAPDDRSLDRWDGQFRAVSLLVDTVAVATSIASLGGAAGDLWAVASRQSSFTARKLSLATLKSMNRSERMRVISEAFWEASRTPEGRDALVAAARRANVGPRSIGSAELSVAQASRMTKVISHETQRRLLSSGVKVLAGLESPIVSRMSPEQVGSASGVVNWIINLIDTGPAN